MTEKMVETVCVAAVVMAVLAGLTCTLLACIRPEVTTNHYHYHYETPEPDEEDDDDDDDDDHGHCRGCYHCPPP